jgi:arginine decarboxylase
MSIPGPATKDPLRVAQERIAKAAADGNLDQRRAPMLEALRAFHECEPASFSIPAHKAGRALDDLTREILGDGPYRADAPAHKGLDDRVSSYKVQSLAQDLAADAFGADQALFSTNGSTLSVQIAVMAVTHPGQEVAVARNVHKSVISGLILSGAHPVFVDPVYDDEYALAHTVTPEALAKALDAHPDAKATLAVSPTVAGVAADVAALADVCHKRGIPLVMDDAWGADFSFHPELPPGLMDAGADLSVASFHKSLTGLMQTSIILVQGDRVDMERLQLALDGFETTSTSALLVASMDAARRAMALHGEELLGRTLALSRGAGQKSVRCPASG